MLRPAQAARRFCVSKRTLNRWADAGLIGRAKEGRVVWLNARDIAELIDARTTRRVIVPMPAAAAVAPVADWRRDEFWLPAITNESASRSPG